MSDSQTATALANNASSAGGRLGIVGLGLIGGSLALAAKRAGWHVTAYNRTAATAAAAAASGDIDSAAADIAELGQCDIICICVPMQSYDDVFKALAPALTAHTVITDAGSTKQDAIAIARRHLGDAHQFVPAHPIAGKEESGWHAASPDLFENHLTVLCPHDTHDSSITSAVETLWRQTGALTCIMDAATHDKMLAQISHLPHLLAYALVSAIDKQDNSAQLLQFAAGGFRDFTRIASSHPQMWRDICLANADNILDTIALYQRELSEFADYIKNCDGDALLSRFHAARALRQQWLNTLEQ